jgi:DNA gyrase subunit B
MFPIKPIKLEDCQVHGAGTELFIVEGDSAWIAVTQSRDFKFQATLPMQGKPMNAMKASEKKVAENSLFEALTKALGTGFGKSFDLKKLRYEKVMLLMDPDADGIHCGALMLMFFYRWMRPLLEGGHIELVRAPIGEIVVKGNPEPEFAYTNEQFQAMCEDFRSRGVKSFTPLRYRGLASINPKSLEKNCLHPATRKTLKMGIHDAEMALEVFGAGKFLE